MFLDWIAQLGLLQHDPQSNIISSLPLLSQRLVISEVTKNIPKVDLCSPAHLNWYMEVLGQGFNLPLEDMNITSDDVEMYSKWLFTDRPKVITPDLEQEFYQRIFRQISLLFQPRLYKNTSPLVQRHIDLCKKALNTLLTAGRSLRLTQETWTVLLKVTLGITDYLLKDPTLNNSMSDELCDDLIETLFELWIRSNLMQVEMWNILKSCFNRWTHRSKVIHHWNNICLSLTRHVHQFTFTQKKLLFFIKFRKDQQELDLPSEFLYYAWHRFTYLITNPLSLSPHHFSMTISGISHCIDALSRPNQDTSTVPIQPLLYPDGNTLLHMFGNFLFDASASVSSSSLMQKGSSESFATLIRIFTTPQKRRPFLDCYIKKFYAALMIGLKTDACLSTIIMSSTQLFTSNLKGVRMLVSDYIIGIRKILPKLKINDKGHHIDHLRLAAIRVLSTIMCVPNYFDYDQSCYITEMEHLSMDQHSTLAGSEQEQLTTELIRVLYNDQDKDNSVVSLKFYILETLVMSLRTETSSYNMRYILHLINVYVIEDASFCPGLVGTVIKLIQEKILSMQLPADVTLVAFDVLMHFVDAYEFLKRDSKNVSRELVLGLCRYIDMLIYNENITQIYPLIVQAYECMMTWILVSRWIIDDHDCYKAVISTLSKGITLLDKELIHTNTTASTTSTSTFTTNTTTSSSVPTKKASTPTTPTSKQFFQLPPRAKQQQQDVPLSPTITSVNKRNKKEEIAIQMAAEYCMSQFINHFNRYKKHIEQQDDTKSRYFLLDDSIIIALSDQTMNVPTLNMIIRDSTGRYDFQTQITYHEDIHSFYKNNIISEYPPMLNVNIPKEDDVFITIPTTIAYNEDDLPTLESLNWNCESLKQAMQQQVDYNTKPASKKEPMKTRLNDKTAFRLLLSQLGFILPFNIRKIKVLPEEEIKIALDQLDQLSERDCISISVYYAEKGGGTKYTELTHAKSLAEPFLQFIHCVGWPVDITQHDHYKGKQNMDLCKNLIYYSNRTVELVLNIPYFLNDANMQEMTASEDHVAVIWMEDMENYKELAKEIKQHCNKNMVYLFIHPLENTADSLYWIRIWVPPLGNTTSAILASQRLHENALIFGPLVDGMVISKHGLGSMVRSTAISAHQACRIVTDTFTRPHVVRRNYIKRIAEQYSVPSSLSTVYNNIFT